jgi:hypothetical protein
VGIDLLWRATDGSLRDAAYDDSAAISEVITSVREDACKRHLLLSTIDPYGDTRFLSEQASRLVGELEALRRDVTRPGIRIAIGRLISIARAADGAVGEWLEFIGD